MVVYARTVTVCVHSTEVDGLKGRVVRVAGRMFSRCSDHEFTPLVLQNRLVVTSPSQTTALSWNLPCKMPLVIIYAKCCREHWVAALLCISWVKHFGFSQRCGISAGEMDPPHLVSKSCPQVLLPYGLGDWQSECV